MYDRGWIKSYPTEIPSICVGNVALGGTGKTPMTELVIRLLSNQPVFPADADIYGFAPEEGSLRPRRIAVISRGYKRKTKGFQVVQADGTAAQFGDEPLQIKRKFPDVDVVVDANRNRAAAALADPSKFSRPDILILDDAFQHRKIRATRNIVLTSYAKPFFKDFLVPFGTLRDLAKRVRKADMIIVTKCPGYLDAEERARFAKKMGVKNYDLDSSSGTWKNGNPITVLFSTVGYDQPQPVFPEGDPHYIYSHQALVVSGIADGDSFADYVGKQYSVMDCLSFRDHHSFSKKDVNRMVSVLRANPILVGFTTEKDAQRLRDCFIPNDIKARLFYIPISTRMLSSQEQNILKSFLDI